MDACKELMMMHRGGFFMPERIHYRKRVTEAILHYPDKVMSSIIDGKNSRNVQLCLLAFFKLSKLFFHKLEIHVGASQNHCMIPHAGPNATFVRGMDQHLEGVIDHGNGLTLYR